MDSYETGFSGRVITHNELFNHMKESDAKNINEKLNSLEKYLLSFGPYSKKDTVKLERHIRRLKSKIKTKWLNSQKKEEVFVKKYKLWLSGMFILPKKVKKLSKGRPQLFFSDSSERSKRRKTEGLRRSNNLEVLTFAAQSKLGEQGKRDAASVLKEIVSSPRRATKYKKAFRESLSKVKEKLSPKQAFSMFIEAELSTSQYETIRSYNPDMYPCYTKIQEAKLNCYPEKDSFHVTETLAEIKLQSLMNHTASRLLMDLEEVLETLQDEQRSSLMLICKWGCDGARQAQYKQKFECDSDSDANLFQSSFVPLRLICSTNSKVLWQNPTPSSPRYCRPIRLRFIKETADVIKDEITSIQNAVKELQKTEIQIGSKTYAVAHNMMLTMIDGKVCNAATKTTSTMKCYICGLTSKDFNCLQKKGLVNAEALDFGLSILHARIRLFESILHLAYKLPVKKWQLRSDSEKAIVKQKKLAIQEEFKTKMGLIVDVPKANFGNTNDGNSSRRFFANHELSAEITGIDINLIYRLKIILEVLSSGYDINTDQLSLYARETAQLYIERYSWHPMTPTLHKILIHGPEVIEKALLPIGQLSEEAAEARNKYIRLYRQSFARKFSREACNLDILNRLLLNSDPVMTGMRPKRRKISQPFAKETIAMLQCSDHDLPDIPSDDEP